LIEALADDLSRENDGEQSNFKSVDVTHADIEQQWIVVYSPQANARSGAVSADNMRRKALLINACLMLCASRMLPAKKMHSGL
jgi:hypothetical protein